MTKTTTEDRDGFRLETVDYTAEDTDQRIIGVSDGSFLAFSKGHDWDHWFERDYATDECRKCGMSFDYFLDNGRPVCIHAENPPHQWNKVPHYPSPNSMELSVVKRCVSCGEVCREGQVLEYGPCPGTKNKDISFQSAIAETWPINWDWADYYFNTLILACLRQAADVVVGRVLSGKNPQHATVRSRPRDSTGRYQATAKGWR